MPTGCTWCWRTPASVWPRSRVMSSGSPPPDSRHDTVSSMGHSTEESCRLTLVPSQAYDAVHVVAREGGDMRRSGPARRSALSVVRRAACPRPGPFGPWMPLLITLGLLLAAPVLQATAQPAPGSPAPLLKGGISSDAPATNSGGGGAAGDQFNVNTNTSADCAPGYAQAMETVGEEDIQNQLQWNNDLVACRGNASCEQQAREKREAGSGEIRKQSTNGGARRDIGVARRQLAKNKPGEGPTGTLPGQTDPGPSRGQPQKGQVNQPDQVKDKRGVPGPSATDPTIPGRMMQLAARKT